MGKKISELPPAGSLSDNDIIPIVDSNDENKTVTGAQIKSYAASGKQNSILGGSLGFDENTYDLNDYNTVALSNKVYWVNCANVLHGPVNTGFGYLEILKYSTGSATLQRYTRYSSDEDILGEIYIRMYTNNTWRGWVKIATPLT